jgi:hypothetical protein
MFADTLALVCLLNAFIFSALVWSFGSTPLSSSVFLLALACVTLLLDVDTTASALLRALLSQSPAL